jgi:hypothetical protein
VQAEEIGFEHGIETGLLKVAWVFEGPQAFDVLVIGETSRRG